MSWQEDLRRLDVELAAGRITHGRYRKVRDELLAGKSGGAAPSPVTSPLRRPTGQHWQSIYPDPQPQPTTPLTPPTAPPLFPTDQPMSAPSPADTRATDSMPVPRVTNTPVDRSTFALPSPSTIPMGMAQPGPTSSLNDPFSHQAVKNRQRRVWLFVSLGVLVAALLIGGSWWLGTHNTGGGPPAPPSANPPAAPGGTVEGRLPVLPGIPNPNNSTMPIAKGQALGLYPAQSADTFTRNGATEVIFRGSAMGADSYLVMVIPTSGPGNARAAVEELYRDVLTTGFTAVQSDLRTATTITNNTRMNVTWYASGDKVVSVGVSQPVGAEPAVLMTRREQTVNSMRDVLPAG
jgi:hypothetical protein